MDKKYVLLEDIEEKANAYIGHMALACEYDQSDAVAAFLPKLRDISAQDVVSKESLDALQKQVDTLRKLISGEWVKCDDVEAAMNITFREGLKMFDFGRMVEWNKPPLNGQYVVTKFRLDPEKIPDKYSVEFWTEEDNIGYAKVNSQSQSV